MLISDVFMDELWRPERLLTDLAAVLLALLHFSSLVDAVNVLHFHEDLIVLWILHLLLRPLGQNFLGSVQILQLKLPSRGEKRT